MMPSSELNTMLAATAYLLTRYGIQCGQSEQTPQSMQTAKAIKQHLEMLLDQDDIQACLTSRSAYRGLLAQWEHIIYQHQKHAKCEIDNYQIH